MGSLEKTTKDRSHGPSVVCESQPCAYIPYLALSHVEEGACGLLNHCDDVVDGRLPEELAALHRS